MDQFLFAYSPTRGDVVKKATLLLMLAGALALVLLATGCSGGSGESSNTTESKGTIVVGSKIDTEGELLSSIIKLTLEDAGY
jgi:glycine betaine/choline ABC-type transport system substrate-binding protein